MARALMHRRTVLAGATAAIGGIAGCLGSAEENEESQDVPPDGIDGGTHRFYLANLDAERRRVELSVSDTDAERYVIDGTYDVPDERGAEFARVAKESVEYEVAVTVANGVSMTKTWAPAPCPTPGGGSRNAVVRIRPSATELTYAEDNCDEITAGTSVPFGSASEFVVDTG